MLKRKPSLFDSSRVFGMARPLSLTLSLIIDVVKLSFGKGLIESDGKIPGFLARPLGRVMMTLLSPLMFCHRSPMKTATIQIFNC